MNTIIQLLGYAGFLIALISLVYASVLYTQSVINDKRKKKEKDTIDPTSLKVAIDKDMLNDLDKMAMDWAKYQLQSFYHRLNFWLVTEGLILTAFATMYSAFLENNLKTILIGICLAGIIMNFVWYSMSYRSRKWLGWFFKRGREYNKARFKENPGDYEQYRLYAHSGELGGGINLWTAIFLLNLVFNAIWIIFIYWLVWLAPL